MSSMDPAGRINRNRLNAVIARFFRVPSVKLPVKDLARIIPPAVLGETGRINEVFLVPIAQKVISDLFPAAGRSADELIAELRKEDLTRAGADLTGVYQSLVKEREKFLKLAQGSQKLSNSASRLKALIRMVQGLGLDAEENQKVAVRCVREGLGFSGARVYTVDVKKGTWLHCLSEGEEGISSFTEPGEPKPNSEKAYINKLLGAAIPRQEIEKAKSEGLYEWHLNGEWGYLYIPNRSRCDFVDAAQLEKDEQGDPAQQRKGYGPGMAREILYLIFGRRDQQEIEVYMVTNWGTRRPLFFDKEQDLELLHTFATAMVRARQHAEDHQKVIEETVHDPLTGIHNRKYFERKLAREVRRTMRWEKPISLGYIDIDHFKEFNDTYGHAFGDQVLKRVAEIMKDNERSDIDAACRIGGEEFAVILPQTSANDAVRVMERIRASVEKEDFIYEDPETHEKRAVKVTISAGVSGFDPPDGIGERVKHMGRDEFSDFIEQTEMVLRGRADNALYEAKNSGRNAVKIHQKIVK